MEKPELITKLHPDIDNRKDTRGPTITFTGMKRVYFSAGAVDRFKLKVDDYVSFVRIGNNWYMLQGDDLTGFKLWLHNKKQRALCVSNSNLNTMFLSDLGRKGWTVCRLKQTNTEYNGKKLVALLPMPTVKNKKEGGK